MISCRFETGRSVAYSAAIVTKMKMPPTHAAIAMSERLRRLVAADPRVQQRRDDERDRAERLHHDERRERERAELADDREPQHDGADHPRRPTQQAPQLARR